jgi:hypothetical protein
MEIIVKQKRKDNKDLTVIQNVSMGEIKKGRIGTV